MICHVCNGFNQIDFFCEECGGKMNDMGKRMDYEDKYSAYLTDLYEDNVLECEHLLVCTSCFRDRVVGIRVE
ncbi:hypothetical protein [Mangrovibacillus cuniculi]|uniref:Uncharacterized protein n=1 Tax=Mangrovibacillus cuniculi TaxID=2593652 RepID=A0A7S8C9M9_9BACI|nr:hypothetical protein [Mangrovibacillus cuniculi]QPC45962.1 hypothetical protein G8O30_02805 [Mangrovibacillus cuniculi]